MNRRATFGKHIEKIFLYLSHIYIYIVSLYKVCSNYAHRSEKWPCPRVHMFYIDLYNEKLRLYILLIMLKKSMLNSNLTADL